jgi:hypothetical protein
MAKPDDSDRAGRAAAAEPDVSGGALRITFGDPGTAAGLASSTVAESRDPITLTIEQQEQVRVYLESSAAFFALLDIWLRAGERGEATTPKELAMLRFAGRVLCKQHEEVAALLQKLVH